MKKDNKKISRKTAAQALFELAKCYEVNHLQAGVSSVTLVLSSIATALIAPPMVRFIF